MKTIVFFILLSSYYLVSAAPIGEIFGRVSNHIESGFKKIKCGSHKITGKVFAHQHEHDPCEEHVDDGSQVNQPYDEKYTTSFKPPIDNTNHEETDNTTKSKIDNVKQETSSKPSIDVRNEETETTTKEGRRLIHAPPNCEEGYIADNEGICREEF